MPTSPSLDTRQRAAAAPQPSPTLGCSLQEVALVTITRALVITSAPRTLPRISRMSIGMSIPMGRESRFRLRQMGLLLSILFVAALPHVTMGIAIAVANGRAVTWKTEAGRVREEDDLLKGGIGSILIVLFHGVSYTETVNGVKGLMGLGDTGIVTTPGLGSSKGPMGDPVTRCAYFVLDQGMRAAAYACFCAEVVGSPPRILAIVVLRSNSLLFHRRAAMVVSRQSARSAACASSTGELTRARPMADTIGACRLEIRRCVHSTAASTFSLGCAAGRVNGPRRQLVVKLLNGAPTACGTCKSAPDPPLSTKLQWGRRQSTEELTKVASLFQLPGAAPPSHSMHTELEGAPRLGRRAARPQSVAATLPPPPAATPSDQRRGAHRPPPTMPPPSSPGIPSKRASLSQAMRAVR